MEDATAEIRKCPKCARKVLSSAALCLYCGARVDDESRLVELVEPETTAMALPADERHAVPAPLAKQMQAIIRDSKAAYWTLLLLAVDMPMRPFYGEYPVLRIVPLIVGCLGLLAGILFLVRLVQWFALRRRPGFPTDERNEDLAERDFHAAQPRIELAKTYKAAFKPILFAALFWPALLALAVFSVLR